MRFNQRPLYLFICWLGYLLVAFLLYSAGIQMGLLSIPTEANLLKWDAAWYWEISHYGYLEENFMGKFASTVFYPLFPLLTKVSHLGTIGVVFLNLTIFTIGLLLLANHFQLSIARTFLFLTQPSLIFIALPYPEALSFTLLAAFIVLFNKQQYVWAACSLLLAGWARPLIWTFLPVLLFWLAIDWRNIKSTVLPFACLLLTLLLSYMAFSWYLHGITGIWNANVRAYGYFGGHFQLPRFPFWTHGDAHTGMWTRQLDYLAFATALLSIVLAGRLLYKSYKKQYAIGRSQLLFGMACTYLASLMLVRLFSMGGDLWSLNRYVFVNPFFLYFLYFTGKAVASWKKHAWQLSYLLTTQISMLHHGLLGTWIRFPWANLQFILFCAPVLLLGRFYKPLYWALLSINLLVQCYLFNWFISGEWLG